LKGANILITTFGLTWQVVPELLGFTNPGLVNLYRNHPRREEIDTALPSNIDPVFHGIINEEQTPVGHVHLGLVYRILVSDRDGFRPGRELEYFAWMDEDEILSRPLELWSRLALNLLDAEEE